MAVAAKASAGDVVKRAALVYIAGPYTLGDPVRNTRRALDAFDRLARRGFTPICPHLSLFAHLLHPHSAKFWYAYDLRVLERCDVVLRLPGASVGSDAEVARARELKIPVVFGLHTFLMRFGAPCPPS